MLSAFQAPLFAESLLGNSSSPFEAGFSPWECNDPSFLFPSQGEPVVLSPQVSQEPVSSNSGSDTQNPSPSNDSDEPVHNELKIGSDYSNRNKLKNKRSGSDETSQLGCIIDERKLRRMASNRESARRSRMRKQRHLENLRNQANRFKAYSREQMNRMRVVVHQTQSIRRENECLRTEAMMLRQRLWDVRQVLAVRQLQQFYPSAMH